MKLGSRQLNILKSLQEHKGWRHPHNGWVWDTVSGTRRTLDQLVDKGLVNKTSMNTQDYPVSYVINGGGEKYLKNSD